MIAKSMSTNGSQKPNSVELAKRHEIAEKSLSSRYDALSQLLGEAELHLRGLKLLRPVWVAYNHQPFQAEGFEHFNDCEMLGIVKLNDKWRLCHAVSDDMDCQIEGVQPIIECPVEIRVRAASIVRQLHEEIVKAKEQIIPEVDAAIQELTELCCII